ncbi:TetR/AcrR family transcriptional regulator [Rathayibacter sp. VKM Ac-2805]|uniref:TetR/AcrR family transcriptional regulator n=1 Tax=Rathayibacter sp. VKM Ac-2805 TaxID=2609258 RepID=UPI00131FD24B|nr:TetR/AcrR family transcriptional regulator [Rathayibacter sp. VKM Ac-2805]QHC75148.1 TetR family transcriptional regulator [Rathayibacter sp. VKM Ac-2805]
MTGSINRSTSVEPQQDRARRTRAIILASARQIVVEVGRERATTALVAARAGVGIGTVYRYYSDFADLLEVVLGENDIHARHNAVLWAAHKAASSGDFDDAETIALNALRALIDALKKEPLPESDLRLYA